MNESRNSILYSCVRAFLSTLSAMVAFAIGLIAVIAIVFGLLDNLESKSSFSHIPEEEFTPTIVADAHDTRELLDDKSPVMLKINIDGVVGVNELNMHTLRQQLVEANEGLLEGRVKGVLLHIDSPGGTVTDADGIYRAIKDFKAKHHLPVYAYVDGLCASGAMYIAAAADKVFASDVSLVGSVGVLISPFFNVTELMKKIGVESKTLTAGLGKDEMNPFRPWKPGEENSLKSIVDYYYAHFVDVVTSNRPSLSKEKLIKEYGAQVFPAPIAKTLGFIDESGYSLNDAKKALAQQMAVAEGKYQVVKLEHRFTLTSFFEEGSEMMKGGLIHRLDLGAELNPKLSNKFLYLYLPR